MDNREVYREKAQAKLDELNARIDLLKAQMKGEAADAKLALNGQVDVLENLRADLQSRMSQLRTGAGDAWDEIAKGLDHAMDEVEHALERAGEALEKAR
jgi:uncharacterized protein YukE